jgi:alginate biosynthesis protein AlgX
MAATRFAALFGALLMTALAPGAASAFEICADAKDPQAFPEHDRWAVIAEQGLDGWIFAKGELAAPGNLGEAEGYLSRLAAALRHRGVTPYMVSVPPRLAVAQSKLDRDKPEFRSFSESSISGAHHRRIEVLNRAGFISQDLVNLAEASGLGAEFFFHVDHHWSSAGIRAVARDLGAMIRDLPGYAAMPRVEWQLLSRNSRTAGTYRYVVMTRCGDGVDIPPMEILSYKAVRATEATADALLGDEPPAPVVLVGTSQSRREEFDLDRGVYTEDSFAALLRHELGVDVLNAAVPGGGSYVGIDGWLSSDEYQLGSPEVLVWETNDGDGFVDFAALRRIVPAAWGMCSEEDALVQAKGPVGPAGIELLNRDKLPIQGSDYYLALQLTDKNVREFDLTVGHTAGAFDNQHMARSALVANSGRFFLEFADGLDSPVQSVAISLPADADGSYVARICKVPTADAQP